MSNNDRVAAAAGRSSVTGDSGQVSWVRVALRPRAVMGAADPFRHQTKQHDLPCLRSTRLECKLTVGSSGGYPPPMQTWVRTLSSHPPTREYLNGTYLIAVVCWFGRWGDRVALFSGLEPRPSVQTNKERKPQSCARQLNSADLDEVSQRATTKQSH